jgi:hypothetical protein
MRVENWPSRLNDVIQAAEGRPFSWGDWDCGAFVGACVEAVTGSNPMQPFAGQWDSETGMLRALAAGYGGSLEQFWTAALGGDPVPVVMAGRGDVVLVQDDDGVTASGIVDLSGERVACLSLDGLEFARLSAAIAAWKV